ncbi:MAG: EamA family transporter [Candidatus Helarchaeota archaeon]
MAAPFDVSLLLIMTGYGLLSGAGIFCFKLGIEKVTDFEVSVKTLFKNPILTIYKFIKVPLVLLGAIIAISGFLVYQFALLTYDVTVVKPLTNLNIVFIFIFGFVLLKEKITKREALGMTTMISGVIFLSMYVEDTSTSPNILNIILFSIGAILISVLFFFITSLKESRRFEEYFIAISSGIFFGLGVLFNKAIYETGFTFDIESYIFNPFTYLLIISYMFGLFIEVIAFKGGRLIVAGPIVGFISLTIPVIGAIFIFNESLLIFFAGELLFPLSYLKLLGIILILIGMIAIYPKMQKQRMSTLNSILNSN